MTGGRGAILVTLSLLGRLAFRPCRLLLVIVTLLLAIAPNAASAHVRWFIEEENYPPQWDRLFALSTLLVIVVSLALLGALLLLRKLVGNQHFPNPPFLAYMEPSATAILAVHTGISLIFFASQVDLFVHSLQPVSYTHLTLPTKRIV